jgi:hypothetical protein
MFQERNTRNREGKPKPNQKGFTTMKKTSYEATYATLTSINYDNAEKDML